ncbi:MAG: bifunctional DNA-formamidopyrimidine glycosylase/DNA-(apurinic or apyrimidinic site) lyase [Hyphomicrobiales bacterium]|nr:bifunctional DNA-formamidopyrimidine glycosylase/DNA-(apurinic or apyrimidinic site) lyase [Hyphomicrobiales bacterium]
MPELPEVETVRRGLAPVLEGAVFAHVEQRRANLRFPFPAQFQERLTGRRVDKLERRAKYLLARLDDRQLLVMHLGMSGRFIIGSSTDAFQDTETMPGEFVHKAGESDKHDHVIFEMSNLAVIRYNDARRFGYMTLVEDGEFNTHPLFCKLGIEPLGGDLDTAFLARKGRGRKQPLKSFLLDQRIIAGLGNIYVCEALFRAGLKPDNAASVLATRSGAPSQAARRLAPAICAVLEDALAAGGSSLRDYRKADGSLGYFQHSFGVYGREGEPCGKPRCGGTIQRLVQNGRSTFYCRICQK